MNTLNGADAQPRQQAAETYANTRPANFQGVRRAADRGRTAVWQARLVLLAMINIAQLWILSATIEAALAGEYRQLVPLIGASAICWLIALTIFLWWKPASSRRTNTGNLRR